MADPIAPFDTADPLIDPDTGLTRLDIPDLGPEPADSSASGAKQAAFRTHYTIQSTAQNRTVLLASYQDYQQTLLGLLDKPEEFTGVARATAFLLLLARLHQADPAVPADYFVGVTDVILDVSVSPLFPSFLLVSPNE